MLLKYHFGLGDAESVPNKYRQAWVVASLANGEEIPTGLLKAGSKQLNEQYYTGNFKWSVTTKTFPDQKWDPQKKKYIPFENERKELGVERTKKFTQKNKLNPFLGIFKSKGPALVQEPSVYADLLINEPWLQSLDNDIARFLSLVPNHPSPLLISIIEHSCRFPASWSEVNKRVIIRSLEYLANIWPGHGGIPNDFLGISMMCPDPTARAIAGEIWIKAVSQCQVNNARVGTAIAKINKYEFAPIKRFCDLAVGIYALSPQHKKGMFELVQYCLKNLPGKPIRNLKKLLEIFKETIYDKKLVREDALLKTKLDQWKGTKSLEKLVGSIV